MNQTRPDQIAIIELIMKVHVLAVCPTSPGPTRRPSSLPTTAPTRAPTLTPTVVRYLHTTSR